MTRLESQGLGVRQAASAEMRQCRTTLPKIAWRVSRPHHQIRSRVLVTLEQLLKT